jgi:hypothetical protein
MADAFEKIQAETYEVILDDVIAELDDTPESDMHGTEMLEYLKECIEYDLSEPLSRLPSLMQTTVETMQDEYGKHLIFYPKFTSFLSRIQELY